MKELSITYYPVGNGDTSLIYLSDGATIIVDCHILEDGVFDVKSHLLSMLRRDEGVSYVDAFILTHPHDDHIHGFQKTFYTGDPVEYSEDDKENDLIIIDELWFAPRIFNEDDDDITEEAKAFKEEAERRIELYRNGDDASSLAGNRLRLVGATGNLDCSGLEDVRTLPGDLIDIINHDEKDDFRFFVYAPVKKDTDDETNNLNNTSIVLQARFDVDGEANAVRAFFGGDAESSVWERIVDRNEDENLEWDLLLAPHHCSWTFFNENGDDPLETSLHLLKQNREGASVISSSKPIKDDDDNPPSHRAQKEYVKSVGKDNFLCTGSNLSKSGDPEPICFVMSKNGPSISSSQKANHSMTVGAISGATSQPRTYG